MTLYEINHALIEVFERGIDEETGEINENAMAELNALKLEKEVKMENIALYIKNLTSNAEQIRAESQKLTDRARSCERKAEWLKEYLKYALHGEKLATSKVAVSYRTTKSVECTLQDISGLPTQFLRYKEPELNKTEVKKFLEEGGELNGCSIKENKALIIK